MRRSTILLSSVLCFGLAACGGAQDEPTDQLDAAMKAGGVPSAAAVEAALAAGNDNTGGRLSAGISGARTAQTEITDIGYCVTNTYSMEVFALGGNNSAWSVSIGGLKGTPTLGEHRIAANGDADAYSLSVSDKSTGSAPAEWQQYESTTGSVTFTNVTPTSVEGTFSVQAAPKFPKTAGPGITVTGTFASPLAEAC